MSHLCPLELKSLDVEYWTGTVFLPPQCPDLKTEAAAHQVMRTSLILTGAPQRMTCLVHKGRDGTQGEVALLGIRETGRGEVDDMFLANGVYKV